jgi:hypothetical protein
MAGDPVGEQIGSAPGGEIRALQSCGCVSAIGQGCDQQRRREMRLDPADLVLW